MPVIDVHTHMLTLVNALPADQAKRISGKNAEALFGL